MVFKHLTDETYLQDAAVVRASGPACKYVGDLELCIANQLHIDAVLALSVDEYMLVGSCMWIKKY